MRPVVVFLGPTLSEAEARAVLDAEYMPPAATATSCAPRCAGRRRSPSSTACSSACRPSGTRRSCSPCPRGSTCTARRAWAPSALRSSTASACGASVTSTAPTPRAYWRTTTRSRSPTPTRSTVSGAVRLDGRRPRDAGEGGGGRGGRRARPPTILARVKATFYAKRVLLAALDREDVEHERLRAWLPEGWVRRKREDAVALLGDRRDDLAAGLEPFRPTWTLQRTRYWEDARLTVELTGGYRTGRSADSSSPTRISRPFSTRCASTRSPTARCSSARCSPRSPAMPPRPAGSTSSSWAHQTALDEERRRRGLLEPEDVEAWLEEARPERGRVADRRPPPRGAALGARRPPRLRRGRDGAHGAVRRPLMRISRREPLASERCSRRCRSRRPCASTTTRSSRGTSATVSDRRFRSRWMHGRRPTAGPA